MAPNLSYSDEHSSNCQCISLYRRNPKIIPAACFKCLTALKEFGSIESIKDVFKSSNFGYRDVSSLAVASNFKSRNLHQTNFMAEEHNSHLEDKEQVIEVLKKAVVDDVLIPSSLSNREKDRVLTKFEN